MKNTIIISAFLTLAFVSCSKEAFEEVTSVPIKVYTCSDETKTAIASDGLTINWSAGDKISVIDNFGVNNCLTASTSGSSSTTFEGNVSKGSTQLYAVYPYAASASASGSVVKTTLPATQTAVNGNIPANTNIAVASASKGPSANEVTMNFKNACMFIKFKVPSTQSGVTSVVFSSANGTNLAGTVSVNAASSEPVASVVSNGSSSVTLSGTISAGGTYYLVVPAVTINGFSITLNGSSASISRSSTRTLEGVRGKVWDLSEIAFSAGITGTIVHTTNTDGYLNGSEMTVTPSFPGGDVSSWNVTVKDKNGTTVRTASGTSAVATVTTAASGKPYLPNTLGPYTVDFTYKTVNGSTVTKTQAFSIAAPKPTFTVSANDVNEMYTSYEKYNAGKVADANGLNGLSVYGIKADFTISNDVLKQLAAELRYQTATGDEMTAATNVNTNSYGEFSIGRLPTGTQTIQIICRFDSTSAYSDSFSKTISGIPATYDFGTNAAPSDWTMSNQIERYSDGSSLTLNGYEIRYYYKVSKTDAQRNIYTHEFYTTSGTKVTYSAVMCAGQTGLAVSSETTDIDGYVGITSSSSTRATTVHKTIEEVSRALTNKSPKKVEFKESNVIMPNQNMISFSASHTYEKTTTQHYVILRSFTIKYEAK